MIHNAQSHQSDYSGAFQYEDGFLTLILTPEGRIVKHSSTYDPQYFLKDYLGNVRVVYHANPETGMVEVVQEDHYDPFGMKLGGLGYVSDIENKYMFQGKEFNDEAIDTDNDGNTDTYMNWYDFEARQFDPQIGRWHVADPVAQYPSPYVGMGNNPVSLVDPNGMATIWSLEEETTLWYTMAIDSRIHSRHVSYNNSEPLHTAYTEELISRRGAIEISGGGASGDWKAEKLALFYYTQELRRWKAERDEISAYLNEPGPKDNEAMDELASMIQNASSTGLSFGGPGGGGVRFTNETDAYNYMWNQANADRREYAAYITTKGVIVTPADQNTETDGEFLKYYNPTWKNGALYITFENKVYQVIGGIHTHQADNGDYGYGFSTPDNYTTIALGGLAFFSMNFDNTMGAQFSDGKYCYPMNINASRDAVLGGYSLIKYIFNNGK